MTLSEYLTEKNIVPAQFAAQLGVHRSTVKRLVDNHRKPSISLAFKIEAATRGKVKAKDWLAANEGIGATE